MKLLEGVTVLAAVGLAGGAVLLSGANNTGVITGAVASPNGPEAGVWVIAETDDTPTKFRKIVVTNDQGKFLLPELPQAATYKIWVRGYGLADSKPVTAKSGQDLKLAAPLPKTPQEAAQVYPASYWASLIRPPAADQFPGTGPSGNGVSAALKTQSDFVSIIKSCERCHQIGSKNTREIPDRSEFESSVAAWDHRVLRGQRGGEMNSFMTRMGRPSGLKMFADWTDRVAAGAVPPAPPRPQGVERNVVITMWNWGDQYGLVHDAISTDRRHPTLYANGPIYGVDWTNDWLLITDPNNNSSTRIKVPTRADKSTMQGLRQTGFQPYRFFGSTPVWQNPAGPHNPMFDTQGRVWITTSIRAPANPGYCKDGALNPFAAYYPLARSAKQVGYYDPKTGKFTLIDTCFGTHHLQFANDADNTIYFSDPAGTAVGWLNTKMYDETGDEQKSQGWCPTVIDTNGDGKITKPWNEPIAGRATGDEDTAASRLAKFDPTLDTHILVSPYGVIVNPVDGSLWGATDEVEVPGQIFRVERGSNPPATCKTERYMLPREIGYRPRGIDVDRNGVIWTALAGSAQLASFDRRKCKTFSGPGIVDGRQCDEGWTFYREPGPSYEGTNVGTEFNYYNWVDQFNTLGLGDNVPIVNGSGSDSLLVFQPDTKEWLTLRVPYPMGFHSRGADGRIDDPNAGWKGRGVYATYGADAAWHVEGGPLEKGNLVKFQIRPDPLAR
jgi:hypothetical protein